LRCDRLLILLALALALAGLALSPTARAQDACREGCDFNLGSTDLGDNALVSNITGFNNSANGAYALYSNTYGDNNTATGNLALVSNTTGNDNTANGAAALSYNTGNDNTATGSQALNTNTTGTDNTATGALALLSNTTGNRNVAIGSNALSSNLTGGDNTATGVNALAANTADYNTATGYQAMESNTTGSSNTAHGLDALNTNTTGSYNTANGALALFSNTTGIDNAATGFNALYANTIGANNTANGYAALFGNTTGVANTAIGSNALYSNTAGSTNIALGFNAGFNVTGSNNIDIGNAGVAGESAKIRIGTRPTHKNTFIAGIFGVTVPTGVAVLIDNTGHLGTTTSSARFKEAIKPMDKASESILALKPVTFRYKQELDRQRIAQFGLVAEEVERVNPDLVARDDEGKPYSVRYDAVNAMLLNEFLKAHHKIDEQAHVNQQQEAINSMLESTVARQQQEIKALTASVKEQALELQKVSAGLEVTRPAPQMVLNIR
jgi:hypothetical protein